MHILYVYYANAIRPLLEENITNAWNLSVLRHKYQIDCGEIKRTQCRVKM